MIIKESFLLAATNADILAAPSRLASLPADGVMQIEVSATDCDAVNYGTLTLQPPDGLAPFEDLHVPFNGFATADAVMHTSTELMVELECRAGGHVGLAYTMNGTVALALVIVTYSFTSYATHPVS
jgi:hypothetical protein